MRDIIKLGKIPISQQVRQVGIYCFAFRCPGAREIISVSRYQKT